MGAAIDCDHGQRIAVSIIVIHQQLRLAKDQRLFLLTGEDAVRLGDRSAVVQQFQGLGGVPDDAVAKRDFLHRPGEQVSDGDRVVRPREGDDDRVRPFVEAVNARLRRDIAGNIQTVRAACIGDGVSAVASGIGVNIVPAAAEHLVVAKTACDGVVGGEAANDVVKVGRGELNGRRAAVAQPPGRAVGEFDCFDIMPAGAQAVRDDDPVFACCETEHQVISIDPSGGNEQQVGDIVVFEDQTVAGALRVVVDPVVAVARAVDIGVVAAEADQQIAARAAGQGVGQIIAKDRVARVVLAAVQQGLFNLKDRDGFVGVAEIDLFNTIRRCGQEAVDDGDLIARLIEADDEVGAAATELVKRHLIAGEAADFDDVGAFACVADHIDPVAAVEDIGVAAEAAGGVVLALYQLDHVWPVGANCCVGARRAVKEGHAVQNAVSGVGNFRPVPGGTVSEDNRLHPVAVVAVELTDDANGLIARQIQDDVVTAAVGVDLLREEVGECQAVVARIIVVVGD